MNSLILYLIKKCMSSYLCDLDKAILQKSDCNGYRHYQFPYNLRTQKSCARDMNGNCLNPGNRNPFPSGNRNPFPSGNRNSYPSGSHNSYPSGNRNSYPSGSHNSYPSGSQNSYPSGIRNPFPSGNRNSYPSDNRNSYPSGSHNSYPSGNRNSYPSGSQNSYPSGNRNSYPSGNRNSYPSSSQNSYPSGNRNPYPSGNRNSSPSGNRNSSPSGSQNHRPHAPSNSSPETHNSFPPRKLKDFILESPVNHGERIQNLTDMTEHDKDYAKIHKPTEIKNAYLPPNIKSDIELRSSQYNPNDSNKKNSVVIRTVYKQTTSTITSPPIIIKDKLQKVFQPIKIVSETSTSYIKLPPSTTTKILKPCSVTIEKEKIIRKITTSTVHHVVPVILPRETETITTVKEIEKSNVVTQTAFFSTMIREKPHTSTILVDDNEIEELGLDEPSNHSHSTRKLSKHFDVLTINEDNQIHVKQGKKNTEHIVFDKESSNHDESQTKDRHMENGQRNKRSNTDTVLLFEHNEGSDQGDVYIGKKIKKDHHYNQGEHDYGDMHFHKHSNHLQDVKSIKNPLEYCMLSKNARCAQKCHCLPNSGRYNLGKHVTLDGLVCCR